METTVIEFQELVRTLDATIGEKNVKDLNNGLSALKIIKCLLEMLENTLPKDYVKFVNEQINESEDKENVRGEIKKILMYPNFKYLPWQIFPTKIRIVNDILNKIFFKIELCDGKVYANCVSDIKLTDVFYNAVRNTEYHKLLTGSDVNTEACHITLVNSNVVYDVGADKIEKFINENFNQQFTIDTGETKNTFSKDWSVFGQCFVVEIICPLVDKFIEQFSKEFVKINPSTHITFATTPRSLWSKLQYV